MELTEWLHHITGNATAQEMAEKAGLPKRTVQHQISTGRMSIENKVIIGAAYGHNPMRTLIEWEIVNPEWAQVPDIDAALRLATEDQLADEVLRRMKIGVDTDMLTTPVDDLAARRSNTTTPGVHTVPYDDGTVHEWDDTVAYAADSSPEENEERLKRGEDPID